MFAISVAIGFGIGIGIGIAVTATVSLRLVVTVFSNQTRPIVLDVSCRRLQHPNTRAGKIGVACGGGGGGDGCAGAM